MDYSKINDSSDSVFSFENAEGLNNISIFDIDWKNIVSKYCEDFSISQIDIKVVYDERVTKFHGKYFPNKPNIEIYKNSKYDGTKITTLLHELAHHLQYTKWNIELGYGAKGHDSFFSWAHIESIQWMARNKELLQRIENKIEISEEEYNRLMKLNVGKKRK